MEATRVDEGIRVCAAFNGHRVRPIWFRWRDRYYRIKEVNFTWNSNQGSAKLHHYAVTDGVNTYELCFNSHTMEWTLTRVYTE